MAVVKISQLPVATSVIGTNFFPFLQGSTTKQVATTVMMAGMGIYVGAGAPVLSAVSTPAIYIRTDGTPSTSLYVKSSDTRWHPLLSQDAGGFGNSGSFTVSAS